MKKINFEHLPGLEAFVKDHTFENNKDIKDVVIPQLASIKDLPIEEFSEKFFKIIDTIYLCGKLHAYREMEEISDRHASIYSAVLEVDLEEEEEEE